MATIVPCSVEWLVIALEPKGERIVGRFRGDDDEGKAARYAHDKKNRKRWSVRRRTPLIVRRAHGADR